MGWPTVPVGPPHAVATTATAPCTRAAPGRQRPVFRAEAAGWLNVPQRTREPPYDRESAPAPAGSSPGTTPGGGAGGFSSAVRAPDRHELPDNPNPQRETMRALLVALIDRVVKDTAPRRAATRCWRRASWCASSTPRWAS